jgi:hypothetical protein
MLKGLGAILAIACIGIGIGSFVHWGIGLACSGMLLWIDINYGR